MRKINWKLRFKNPMFWILIGGSILGTALSYNSMQPQDLTTWKGVGELLKGIVLNPYLLFICLWTAFASIVDTTSKGIGDTPHAISKRELD